MDTLRTQVRDLKGIVKELAKLPAELVKLRETVRDQQGEIDLLKQKINFLLAAQGDGASSQQPAPSRRSPSPDAKLLEKNEEKSPPSETRELPTKASSHREHQSYPPKRTDGSTLGNKNAPSSLRPRVPERSQSAESPSRNTSKKTLGSWPPKKPVNDIDAEKSPYNGRPTVPPRSKSAIESPRRPTTSLYKAKFEKGGSSRDNLRKPKKPVESSSKSDNTKTTLPMKPANLSDSESENENSPPPRPTADRPTNSVDLDSAEDKKGLPQEYVRPKPAVASDSSEDEDEVSSLPNVSLKKPVDSDSSGSGSDSPLPHPRSSSRLATSDYSGTSDSDSDPAALRRSTRPAPPMSPYNQPSPLRRPKARGFASHYGPGTDSDGSDNDDDDDCPVDPETEEVISDVIPSPAMIGRLNRRGSVGSVQTWDTRSQNKKKKKVSLKPHKAEDLYNEQKKDAALRKLLKKGKTSNMEVRMTKGKNLVFIQDRVYIPESLRVKTMEYYLKKYKNKATPSIQLEKNCYWTDMTAELKSYENDKKKNLFTINVTNERLIITH